MHFAHDYPFNISIPALLFYGVLLYIKNGVNYDTKTIKMVFPQQWRQYAGGIAALLLIAACNVIPAKIIGNVVDAISAHRVTTGWLIVQVIIMLLTALVQYLLRFVWQKLIYGSSYVLERQLRGQLFHHFIAMDPSFYQRWRIGDLMAHATNDVEAVREVASYGILTLADSVITGGSMLLAMGFFVNWKLTLFTCIPLPLLVITAQKLGNKIHVAYEKAQLAFGQLNNKVQETTTGMKVIQSLGEEQADLKDFHHYVQHALTTNQRAYFWDALFNPATTIIMGVAYVIAIAVGGWMVGQQQLSVGQLVTFITYLGELVWPLFAIGTLFNTLERGRASYDRINDLLEEHPAWMPAKTNCAHFGPVAVNVTKFTYPDNQTSVLNDIKFSIPVGSKIGIVGPTGGGKSTLLQLLVRDFDHYQGKITMAGKDIRTLPLDKYRDLIAYVPQGNFLFSTTIADNLRFGNQQASSQTIASAADQAAIANEIDNMPQKYQTLVGQNGTSLSGGQQQRLALGRALVKDSQMLILDDPLSAVDAETAKRISKVLTTVPQSVVMVTSRLSVVQNMDWLIVIENGRITAQGSPAKLNQQAGWYRDTLAEQQHQQELEDDLNE